MCFPSIVSLFRNDILLYFVITFIISFSLLFDLLSIFVLPFFSLFLQFLPKFLLFIPNLYPFFVFLWYIKQKNIILLPIFNLTFSLKKSTYKISQKYWFPYCFMNFISFSVCKNFHMINSFILSFRLFLDFFVLFVVLLYFLMLCLPFPFCFVFI